MRLEREIFNASRPQPASLEAIYAQQFGEPVKPGGKSGQNA